MVEFELAWDELGADDLGSLIRRAKTNSFGYDLSDMSIQDLGLTIKVHINSDDSVTEDHLKTILSDPEPVLSLSVDKIVLLNDGADTAEVTVTDSTGSNNQVALVYHGMIPVDANKKQLSNGTATFTFGPFYSNQGITCNDLSIVFHIDEYTSPAILKIEVQHQ